MTTYLLLIPTFEIEIVEYLQQLVGMQRDAQTVLAVHPAQQLQQLKGERLLGAELASRLCGRLCRRLADGRLVDSVIAKDDREQVVDEPDRWLLLGLDQIRLEEFLLNERFFKPVDERVA